MSNQKIIQKIAEDIRMPFPRMSFEEFITDPQKQGKRGSCVNENNLVIAMRQCKAS